MYIGEYNVAISYNDQQYSESATNGIYLTIYAQPRLSSIYPLAISSQGGDLVTITGTGFVNSSLYTISLYAPSSTGTIYIATSVACTYVSSTQIVFPSPALPYGTVSSVGTAVRGIIAANAQQFTSMSDNYVSLVVYARASVTSLTPLSGALRGGANITITGVWASTGRCLSVFIHR